jgi:hypothetical protein
VYERGEEIVIRAGVAVTVVIVHNDFLLNDYGVVLSEW